MSLIMEGQIVAVVEKKTKSNKPYKVIQFQERTKEGFLVSVSVTDYGNGDYKQGQKVSVPVYVSPWFNKESGKYGAQLLLSRNDLNFQGGKSVQV